MAERHTKIALASAVMVIAVGGSLMFFRPGSKQSSAAVAVVAEPKANLPLRHQPERHPTSQAVPAGNLGHLLGRIEPEAPKPPAKPHAATPARPATSRQTYEVGELPPPNWSPMRPHPGGPPLVHHVREGETLSGLARQYLGSADRYGELFAANRHVLADPNHLRLGMELIIPQALAGKHAAMGEPANPAGDIRKQPKPNSPAQATAPGPMVPIAPGTWRRSRSVDASARHYRVRAEDTLVDIAKQFYGDGSKFQDLLEANRQQISSPDQLHEGLLLVIP